MNRNNVWRLILVVSVILWSLYELYPPKGRDLVQVFREKAVNRDTNFTAIVLKAAALERSAPDKPYEALKEAIGTNDITHYFPFYEAKTEAQPTTFILNRIQREAAGKIRLGLDLQGGTSFLMEMDTNRLTSASDASSALAQAVDYRSETRRDSAFLSREACAETWFCHSRTHRRSSQIRDRPHESSDFPAQYACRTLSKPA